MAFSDITRLSLQLEDHLIPVMHEHAMRHYPKEFGGLLIGRYGMDRQTVHIQDILLPLKYKSSRFYFERAAEGLKESLEKFYKQDPSLIYVGEWHSHPDNDAVPSTTDLQAMRDIVTSPDVNIMNPVLSIMKITKKNYQLRNYVLYEQQLLEYKTI